MLNVRAAGGKENRREVFFFIFCLSVILIMSNEKNITNIAAEKAVGTDVKTAVKTR